MISVLKNLKKWVEDKRKYVDDYRSRGNDHGVGQIAAYDEVIERINEILNVIEYKEDDNG